MFSCKSLILYFCVSYNRSYARSLRTNPILTDPETLKIDPQEVIRKIRRAKNRVKQETREFKKIFKGDQNDWLPRLRNRRNDGGEAIVIEATSEFVWDITNVSFKKLNPHAPDRFTPSSARCAENCGSALTNR